MARYPVVVTIPESLLKTCHPNDLQKHLKALYQETLGGAAKPFVLWQCAPDDQIFTARRPSMNATLIASLPDEFDQVAREAFIRRILAIWMNASGGTEFETVISGAPISKVSELMQVSRNRPAPSERRSIARSVAWQLLKNRVLKGRFEMSVNFD